MEINTVESSHETLPVEVFYYPATKLSHTTVLLLKGIYGLHDPESLDSWDNQLIRSQRDFFNFVCINTARKGKTKEERKSKDAFIGKTFTQECDDVQKSLTFLKQKKLLLPQQKLIIVGNSFGGTLLMGMPDLLGQASATIMIGSGCGKSETTTKPLLVTLPAENVLLETLNLYKEIFIFVRGNDDAVVPKESQNKIIESACNARIRIACDIRDVQHDLSPTDPEKQDAKTSFISSLLSICEKL